MGNYLCYDVKGIQNFIFKIPKLKYIIGGSALIDQFDRKIIPNLKVPGCDHIFSAGGKGAFFCENQPELDVLKHEIIKNAHACGFDIRFGTDSDYSKASSKHDEIYPYVPSSLDGEPCSTSGLYPVNNEGDNGGEHEVVCKRREENRWFEEQLIRDFSVIPGLNDRQVFFRNVDIKDPISGRGAAEAIGLRNRWAVICMDGNDMGMQFLKKKETNPSEKEMLHWFKVMSKSLDNCTRKAAIAGIQHVCNEWHDSEKTGLNPEMLILPVRPIIVGGDDIVILCHASYARCFVKEAIRVFNSLSIQEDEKELETTGKTLWPASKAGHGITISASILYCSVTLPLHIAITYSEALLANAKQRGRKVKSIPKPPCIDWENVTETVIDTPLARRQRELIFLDDDINETVRLTTRPCTLNEFERIEELVQQYNPKDRGKRKIPSAIRHKILQLSKTAFYDRLTLIAELKKNHPLLFQHLNEYPDITGSRWVRVHNGRMTDVIDAMLLIEEEERMYKETVNV